MEEGFQAGNDSQFMWKATSGVEMAENVSGKPFPQWRPPQEFPITRMAAEEWQNFR